MKIMFVVPPDTLSIESSVFRAYEKERGEYPKLGMLYVAAYLEKELGIRPCVVDCQAEHIGYDGLRQRIAESSPDLVAFSVLTFNLLDARKAAQLIKRDFPETKICFGGVHVNLYPRETLGLPEVDCVVHGEGERSFTELVRALIEKWSPERFDGIQGVGWKEGSTLHLNSITDRVPDLNQLPFPARHLIDVRRYGHVLARGQQFMTIQASRGCPYACTFCDIRRTKFRARTAENVISEIEALIEMGGDEFFFVDDTITVQKKLLVEICKLIIQRGLKINFKISSRVDHVNEELLAVLKQAGCYRVHYGVESGSQRVLDYMEKDATLDQIRNAFRITKQAGLQAFAYMMIGVPTETYEEIQQTIRFAISLDADYAQFSICTPYPKTELTNRMLRDGIIKYDHWQQFAENPTEGFEVQFWNPTFSEEQLRALQAEAHARFYGRPSYMLKKLMEVRSWNDFHAKLRVGGKLLLRLRRTATMPVEQYIQAGN